MLKKIEWLLFAAAALREKEKLNERKEKYFVNHSLYFYIFLYCVCAVKAILCTWQCLHTKIDKTWMHKILISVTLLFSSLLLISCFPTHRECVSVWNYKRKREECAFYYTWKTQLWTLQRRIRKCGCNWWHFILSWGRFIKKRINVIEVSSLWHEFNSCYIFRELHRSRSHIT